MNTPTLPEHFDAKRTRYPVLSKVALRVSIAQQTLELYTRDAHHWHLDRLYHVSTGRAVPSCLKDSLGTPNGCHVVCEKIGDGAPLGTVFTARVSTGQCYWQDARHIHGERLVTTRILRLQGLEEGVNQGLDPVTGLSCDTFQRCIYIHGVNHEYTVGHPDTHGCIGLTNFDMLDLYARTTTGTLVDIL